MLTPKTKHYNCVFCNLQLRTKTWMKEIFCLPLFISCLHSSPTPFQTLAAKGGVNRHAFCQHKARMNSQEFPWQWWRTYPNAETLPFTWYTLRNTSVFLKFLNVDTKVPSKAKHGGFTSRYGLRASQLRGLQNRLSRKMWKPHQRFGKSQLRHTRISN